MSRLAQQVVNRILARIALGKDALVVAKYQRQGYPAVIALVVKPGSPPMVRAMPSASIDYDVLTLRSGSARATLATKNVAIVGTGALGSFTADLLARSGIAGLRLVDGDILRPGNVVRHLARLQHVGLPKVEAVKACIEELGLLAPDAVITHELFLVTPDDAVPRLAGSDIVIDATASGPALALLCAALSNPDDPPLLSVGLYRDGGIARVDRFPLAGSEEHFSAIPAGIPSGTTLLEAGCGDPVSPTPAHSVVAASALVVRAATRLLAGQPIPPTYIEVFEPQPDSPFDVEGLLQ